MTHSQKENTIRNPILEKLAEELSPSKDAGHTNTNITGNQSHNLKTRVATADPLSGAEADIDSEEQEEAILVRRSIAEKVNATNRRVLNQRKNSTDNCAENRETSKTKGNNNENCNDKENNVDSLQSAGLYVSTATDSNSEEEDEKLKPGRTNSERTTLEEKSWPGQANSKKTNVDEEVHQSRLGKTNSGSEIVKEVEKSRPDKVNSKRKNIDEEVEKSRPGKTDSTRRNVEDNQTNNEKRMGEKAQGESDDSNWHTVHEASVMTMDMEVSNCYIWWH